MTSYEETLIINYEAQELLDDTQCDLGNQSGRGETPQCGSRMNVTPCDLDNQYGRGETPQCGAGVNVNPCDLDNRSGRGETPQCGDQRSFPWRNGDPAEDVFPWFKLKRVFDSLNSQGGLISIVFGTTAFSFDKDKYNDYVEQFWKWRTLKNPRSSLIVPRRHQLCQQWGEFIKDPNYHIKNIDFFYSKYKDSDFGLRYRIHKRSKKNNIACAVADYCPSCIEPAPRFDHSFSTHPEYQKLDVKLRNLIEEVQSLINERGPLRPHSIEPPPSDDEETNLSPMFLIDPFDSIENELHNNQQNAISTDVGLSESIIECDSSEYKGYHNYGKSTDGKSEIRVQSKSGLDRRIEDSEERNEDSEESIEDSEERNELKSEFSLRKTIAIQTITEKEITPDDFGRRINSEDGESKEDDLDGNESEESEDFLDGQLLKNYSSKPQTKSTICQRVYWRESVKRYISRSVDQKLDRKVEEKVEEHLDEVKKTVKCITCVMYIICFQSALCLGWSSIQTSIQRACASRGWKRED